jgi:tetratricopeptide (TPR) repeat protein
MSAPTKETPPLNSHPQLAVVVCLVLATITLAVFDRTVTYQFIDCDDNHSVYANPVVVMGLTVPGLAWALTDNHTDHWHPLVWLTHMADCQVFGLWAGGHHLINVALHEAAAVLLFLALRELTGNLWRSAFVAAVFAIHPLRAESVAWVAERKDVLSGVFFMLTLWAYGRYVRQPSRWRFSAVVWVYALGLMSKNMLMTLPYVLLLLDWWPLHRWSPNGAGGGKGMMPFWGLVKEKIPLFALSLASGAVTLYASQDPPPFALFSFPERLGNAVISYAVYLRQMFWPAGLAIPYLYPPMGWTLWEMGLALALLAAISVATMACWKERPYLAVGWLWFLGMLVPAIGFVQISYYSHADRYTYLPEIGLALAVTWAVGDLSLGWKHRPVVLGALMAAVIGVLMVCARQQAGYWKDAETLWSHTISCTTGNYLAHCKLADNLLADGKMEEAISHYRTGLGIMPNDAEGRNNLGTALFRLGKVDQAMVQYREALRIRPSYAPAHFNLGKALQRKGRIDEAIIQFRQAAQSDPDLAVAHLSLADLLVERGGAGEAMVHYKWALHIDPGNADAHYHLANLLLERGRVDEAIGHYRRALQINPDYAQARVNLGSILLQEGRTEEAIAQFQQALQIQPNNPQVQDLLARLKRRQAGLPLPP